MMDLLRYFLIDARNNTILFWKEIKTYVFFISLILSLVILIKTSAITVLVDYLSSILTFS